MLTHEEGLAVIAQTEKWLDRLQVRDQDKRADAIAVMWCQVAFEGARVSVVTVRHALNYGPDGRSFPGCGPGSGHASVKAEAAGDLIKFSASRRFTSPDRAAVLAEEVSLIRQDCQTRNHAIVVAAELLSQTMGEAGKEHGVKPDTLVKARIRLIKRCRARARGQR
jgi:hypothetical protein